jgi:hypothetical protein
VTITVTATFFTHVRGSGSAGDGSAHLLHERHLVHAQADEVDPQHPVAPSTTSF